MITISFNDLYSLDFDLHHLFAMKQEWLKDGQEFSMLKEARKTSALLYLNDANVEYITSAGEKIYAKNKDVVYIPQGSLYKSKFFSVSESKPSTMLIEFELSADNKSFRASHDVSVVSVGDSNYFDDIFSEAVKIYSKPVFSVPAFKATVYGLIYTICQRYREKDIQEKDFSYIAPAIEYLEKHDASQINVSELAKMCHISETYFRMQFKKFAGVSPSVYCKNLMITKAKRLLKSERYTVCEVADILGFEDAGYFTKVFKRCTGRLPSSYL